jgi:prepilin-type N-terminal cleavage/methylation domain-containing protein
MKIPRQINHGGERAYTLTEVMVAILVSAVMFVSVYLGISSSFSVIQRTRENLRASQILMQRMETVRLYTWDQLRNVPVAKPFQTNFSEAYDPLGGTNGAGVVYFGTVAVTVPPPVSVLPANCSYRANVALVSVTVQWTNKTEGGFFPHRRQFQTLAAQRGMQQYVYGSN